MPNRFIKCMNLVRLKISNSCWKARKKFRYEWFTLSNLKQEMQYIGPPSQSGKQEYYA
uniref:Uncharacterized protein n=1 Tax=Rhizophora mucronata TaxID=61149 RepID=A0A2P2LZT4_RHIMU